MRVPTMRVVRKQDGHDMIINESDFTEDHYERWKERPQSGAETVSSEASEEHGSGPSHSSMVSVRNPKDRRRRIGISRAEYESDPEKWDLWEE